MIITLKRKLYFFVAEYFKLFARIQLILWKPTIIVLTGSSGKTTLLHLVESQLGEKARYSHHANSAYGIPFDILNLKRTTYSLSEWFYLIFMAPFKSLFTIHNKNLYVVEADCDRSHEGKFLSTLLYPDYTLWLSSSRTHSMNFDHLVAKNKFKTVEEAISYEYGYFIENTKKLVIINADNPNIVSELKRTHKKVLSVSKKQLRDWSVSKSKTVFKTDTKTFSLPVLLPKETFYLLEAVQLLLHELPLPFDDSFTKFHLPPSRSSLLNGINNSTIIDSSYNNSLESMEAMLRILKTYPDFNNKKWAIVGDILEQGIFEQDTHIQLADLLVLYKPDRIVLIGPRIQKYTYPLLLKKLSNTPVDSFEKPDEALVFIKNNITADGLLLLFKGSRFFEGIIEHLLQNKGDVSKLCRREAVWQLRREKFGL